MKLPADQALFHGILRHLCITYLSALSIILVHTPRGPAVSDPFQMFQLYQDPWNDYRWLCLTYWLNRVSAFLLYCWLVTQVCLCGHFCCLRHSLLTYEWRLITRNYRGWSWFNVLLLNIQGCKRFSLFAAELHLTCILLYFDLNCVCWPGSQCGVLLFLDNYGHAFVNKMSSVLLTLAMVW